MDPGFRETIRILWDNGVETDESCEAREGIATPNLPYAFMAITQRVLGRWPLQCKHGLRVDELRRHWHMIDGEPVGPHWQLTFHHPEGGGIHPVEKDGKITYEWGPISKTAQPPPER
jgi:hypothetical protein